MFKIGDILQFIEHKETKIIVFDIKKSNLNSMSYELTEFVDFKYLSDDININKDIIYTTYTRLLEYDPVFKRKDKIKKLIYNIHHG